MKANELRIGNYAIRDNVVVIVDGRSISDAWREDVQYHPIQLTEEWLLRFGFEKSFDCGDDELMSRFARVKISKKKLVKGLYWSYPRQHPGIWTAIEYVHQLQNLYFALTGEELIGH